MKESGCYVWDFTIWSMDWDHLEIILWLTKFCKKYSFQLEEGETKRPHYQGRVSLIKKLRECEIIIQHKILDLHWSRTSSKCSDNDFYVTKEEGRLKGPWRDTDVTEYIPKQIREIPETKFLKWQSSVIEKIKIWDSRHIDVIVDKEGCKGKSFLVGYCCCNKLARKIPPLNNYKEIMCLVMCMPKSSTYFVDMPRALTKDKQEEFYSAIESIKDGHVWDNRYTYKEMWMDSPNIWLFTNKKPNLQLLSIDRWRLWEIDDEGGLRALRCNTIP